MQPLRFYVNGKCHVLRDPTLHTTLADYLRSDAVRLMGTKVGDEDGLFGMDTVALIDHTPSGPRIRPVPATLVPLGLMHGKAVVTVEGLGQLEKMHPIQRQFTNCDASQCGYCLGGFIMTLYTVLQNTPTPTCADIEEAFDGNFCRCTGYNPIAAAAAAFAADAPPDMLARWEVTPQTFSKADEPALPPVFSAAGWLGESALYSTSGDCEAEYTWHTPATLADLVEDVRSGFTMVGGNTHHALKLGNRWASTSAVKELNEVTVVDGVVTVGAGVTITSLMQTLRAAGAGHAEREEFLRFALSTQRRSLATIGGELLCKHAEADITIACCPGGTAKALCGPNFEEKILPISALHSSDVRILVSLTLTPTPAYYYRVARRRVAAEPLVSTAFVHNNEGLITDIYTMNTPGSVIVTHITTSINTTAGTTVDALAAAAAAAAAAPLTGTHLTYRRTLCSGIALKAVHAVRAAAGIPAPADLELHPPRTLGLPVTHRQWPAPMVEHRAVGHYKKLETAASKATGDTRYTADHSVPGMLHAAIVGAPKAAKKLAGFCIKEAEKMPGFVAFVTASDIPGVNHHSGIPPSDTPVLQDNITLYVGEPVALVVARTVHEARAAAAQVKVLLDDITDRDVLGSNPADITKGDYVPDIQTAIARNSYITNTEVGSMVLLSEGDTRDTIHSIIDECPVIVEGTTTFGGQDHTYAETHVVVVEPLQDNTWMIMSSCQNMSKAQHDVAAVLNIPASRVTAHVTHLGGGFGGKQDRPVVYCTLAAVAAKKVNAPVKLQLTRSEDILISSGRHPFYFEYKFGADKDGRIIAGDALCVCDGGSTTDVTPAVLNKAIFQVNGPYTVPHLRVEGRAAKTNRVTPTAYRGFGGPQGGYLVEYVLDQVQRATGKTAYEIRQINLNHSGDQNISGAYNEGSNFRTATERPRQCWNKLVTEGDVALRLAAVDEFNSTHTHVKRAIGFANARNGVVFEEHWMTQAMANVHVMHDGTVMVSHSGVEMGQGLHEKCAAAVMEVLPVDRHMIRILETSTDTCTNTQPTSASSGPDVNIPPIVECCKRILSRLQDRLDCGDTWVGAVVGAYFSAVDLHASAHFTAPPGLNYHWHYHQPGPSAGPTGLYCGYGAGAMEVELDVLTGEWRFLRADLVKDAGRPLNPHSDLGQVEGGAVQGLGLCTTEEIEWDNEHQLTDSVAHYACPTIADVPAQLHSYLLENAPNEVSKAFKAKACEETPTIFGITGFLALKEAVAVARASMGKTGAFELHSPATREKVLLAINAP